MKQPVWFTRPSDKQGQKQQLKKNKKKTKPQTESA